MSKKVIKQTLIDPETLDYLARQRADDHLIVQGIEADRHNIEFKYAHVERLNNFKTDELYLERNHVAEEEFLEKVYDQEKEGILARQTQDVADQMSIEEDQKTFTAILLEMKSLKVQCDQNKAAAEKMRRIKSILKEKRLALRQHLARVEARQENERKNLMAAHARHLKHMNYNRHLVIRDVEDPEIRVILAGNQFNAKTLAAEEASTASQKAEASKAHAARVLAQL
ncbi:hypothetical protein HDV05_004471, partial [Chytridiales sp. JEL 0842]